VEAKGEEKWNHERKVQNGMPMFSPMSFVYGFCFFFFVFLFVFQLVGWATRVGILWLAWYCWLGGVCLDVVVSEFES
jgi:uncharacterized membrane protein YdcZ (DUF606 family)